MIIGRRIRLKWLLQIEGRNILFFLIYGGLVHVLNLLFLLETRVFSMTEIGFFGTAVVILLGFRNNEAYRRYWEARTAWGELTNASRYFASEIMGYSASRGERTRQCRRTRCGGNSYRTYLSSFGFSQRPALAATQGRDLGRAKAVSIGF